MFWSWFSCCCVRNSRETVKDQCTGWSKLPIDHIKQEKVKERERQKKAACLRDTEAEKKDHEEDTSYVPCQRPDANTVPWRSLLKHHRKYQTEYRKDPLLSQLLILLHSSLSNLSSSFILFFLCAIIPLLCCSSFPHFCTFCCHLNCRISLTLTLHSLCSHSYSTYSLLYTSCSLDIEVP